jgi:cytochrome c553
VKTFATLVVLLFVAAVMAPTPAESQENPPAWAYPVNPPDFKLPPDDGTVRRVPGSSAGYTLTQLRDRFLSPYWHPGDYPIRPEIVATGRKPDVFACGFCHRADGPGGPENANLTGLPKAYIVQQMADFKSGARKSSVPNRAPPMLNKSLAKTITDSEIEIAATYFASIKPRSIVSVIETDMVPKSYVTGWASGRNEGRREGVERGATARIPYFCIGMRKPRNEHMSAGLPLDSRHSSARLAGQKSAKSSHWWVTRSACERSRATIRRTRFMECLRVPFTRP